MAVLVTVKGPQTGRQFVLHPGVNVVGRQSDSDICLESRAVSRHHARIVLQEGAFFVEDLSSSNGSYLNGQRVSERAPFTEQDMLQIGPYLFQLRNVLPQPLLTPDTDMIIREQISASSTNVSLYHQDPSHKLQVVLDISRHLSRTLDLELLLGKLLEQLMQLFPHADRGIVLLKEGDGLKIRAQRVRGSPEQMGPAYSRTIVRQALEQGVGLLSEDVQADDRFTGSNTLRALDMRSVLCVPLIAQDERRLGIIQLDRCRGGQSFRKEDLELLATVALQVTVALEYADMHAQLLREERLRQELALAREIQQGYLPTAFPPPLRAGYELFACLYPARQVSGDLYDFITLDDGRLAFFLGDVSGKGMPAALFMVAVRTLIRHLATSGDKPSATLAQLNAALAVDNPSAMFVTLVHGLYQPATGEVIVSSGGHPIPWLRSVEGHIQPIPLPPGRLLGYPGANLRLSDHTFTLQPDETLIMYTDGFTEARAAASKEMFGEQRLQEVLGGPRTQLSLRKCAEVVKAQVEQFTNQTDLQDDLTLMLLRRVGPITKRHESTTQITKTG
ncbi:MAG: SpoIIE family protein phosphatase [Gemmataceae bacterium]